jgi:hypothetical protein
LQNNKKRLLCMIGIPVLLLITFMVVTGGSSRFAYSFPPLKDLRPSQSTITKTSRKVYLDVYHLPASFEYIHTAIGAYRHEAVSFTASGLNGCLYHLEDMPPDNEVVVTLTARKEGGCVVEVKETVNLSVVDHIVGFVHDLTSSH